MPKLGNVEYLADATGVATHVRCPLVNEWIEDVECMENQGLASAFIPARFKLREDWLDICRSCPFRNY